MNEVNNKKSIVITGAVGDIGSAICEKFINMNYYVIGVDIKNKPHKYIDHFIECDLDDLNENDEVLQKIINVICEAHSSYPLKALVNNAAVQILSYLEHINLVDIHKTLNVNVVAPLILSKVCHKYLTETSGSIVNIGSIHANLTKPRFINYATSKSALAGMTRSMAIELAESGVRVNCIEPAAIETKMLKAGFKDSPDSINKLSDYHPLKRIGQPEEVAQLVSFLTGENARFITGETIKLDGGIGSKLHDPL